MKRLVVTLSILFLFPIIPFSQPLTEEQKIADFEYLYEVMEENYPYFGLLERETGTKWLENKSAYIELIKKTNTDKDYYDAIHKILRDLNSGHTDLMPTKYHDAFLRLYKEAGSREPWVKELEKGNDYWSKLLGVEPFNQEEQEGEVDTSLLRLEILEPGNIALLTIKTFNHFNIKPDSARLSKYINSILNYNNLIIDIQDNGGGDTKYWSEQIVPHFVKDTIYQKTYVAFRKGAIFDQYFNDFGEKEDFSVVADKPNLPEEITEAHYKIYSSIDTIRPLSDTDFRGNIYLVVNRNVYSSAEGLAVFCKMTKWATVVGEITGGDGIGTDPVLVCLPNSKLTFRFPGEMGLNPDGSSNEEKNTVPDLFIDGKTNEERIHNLVKLINPKLKF